MAFNKNFIDGCFIELPRLSQRQIMEYSENGLELNDYYLDYINYSVFQNPFRRFPYYTATNIDGANFIEKLERSDRWEKDDRIPQNHQFGDDLYDAVKSDFDRGHMTKREDVQWGMNKSEAKKSADSTFFYTNAVPQHARLNRSIWRRIENYILHSEGVKHRLKLSVFTGPVLNHNDPVFVTKINGESVKIPRIFWKVVYYLNASSELSRVAYITNQSNLLQTYNIVEPSGEIMRSSYGEDDFFLDYKDADTYQTDVSVIESLTLFTFPKANDVYEDNRIVRLILEEVNYRNSQVVPNADEDISLSIKNLML
ncbi:DNA/RNA non-specific endonuclease [Aureisphaera galaxeae]|uniref:DNA/RNA non-specific endonuclease n=1 Tax=Aureisphaera galaxeae TaxID=1538023 RepID=UPI0023507AAF|nr:DNA/RNA non-specific endonuclease [Aureisphaera galaxeae]MDC8004746.1 DNA/RNA non-specific endonuclease [Aureisphaera galaxeae]